MQPQTLSVQTMEAAKTKFKAQDLLLKKTAHKLLEDLLTRATLTTFTWTHWKRKRLLSHSLEAKSTTSLLNHSTLTRAMPSTWSPLSSITTKALWFFNTRSTTLLRTKSWPMSKSRSAILSLSMVLKLREWSHFMRKSKSSITRKSMLTWSWPTRSAQAHTHT